jgi:hypothetical protein
MVEIQRRTYDPTGQFLVQDFWKELSAHENLPSISPGRTIPNSVADAKNQRLNRITADKEHMILKRQVPFSPDLDDQQEEGSEPGPLNKPESFQYEPKDGPKVDFDRLANRFGAAGAAATQSLAKEGKYNMTDFSYVSARTGADSSSAEQVGLALKRDTVDVLDPNVPLDTVLAQVNIIRAQLTEIQIRMQAAEMQARNEKIRGLQDQSTDVNSMLPSGADSSTKVDWNKIGSDKKERLEAILKSVDMALDMSNVTKGDLEKVLNKLRTLIDQNNSTQQLETARLQNLTNIFNQAYEITSNFIQRLSKLKDAIIAALR